MPGAVGSTKRATSGGGRRATPSGFALAALVAVAGTVLLLGLTSKQIFAHYVTPTMPCPARLDFGFVAMPSTHAIFARHALAQPLRWEHTAAGFAYRLQKRTDPPPPQAAAFPVTTVGPVNLYRSK